MKPEHCVCYFCAREGTTADIYPRPELGGVLLCDDYRRCFERALRSKLLWDGIPLDAPEPNEVFADGLEKGKAE